MFWKTKTILAKIETSYAVDPTPTGAANAILCTNVSFNPMEGQDVSRNLERPFFGGQQQLPTAVYATLSFDVEAVGSGTLGVAPAWGPLHRMCAVAEVVTASTKVEYTPISSGLESGALWINIGGVLFKLPGSGGNWVAKFNAQGIPVYSYTFTGLFTQPANAAAPTVDFTLWQAPSIVTSANTPTFTIGGTAHIMRSFELDRGAKVEGRFLVGQEKIMVTDAVSSLKCQIEAPASLGTFNPYTAPFAAPVAVQLIHGTVAAKRIKIDVGQAQQRRPSLTQQQDIVEYPLMFDALPTSAGSDEWKITLS